MAVLLMRFPYSIEQGILCAEQSVLGREQGIPLPKREAIADWISDMHRKRMVKPYLGPHS